MLWIFYLYGVPNGIRTRVAALKGRCPRPARRWGQLTHFYPYMEIKSSGLIGIITIPSC